MGYDFSTDDVAFLRSETGREALRLADSLALEPNSLMTDIGRLTAAYPGRQAALVETVSCRRRAVGKLRDPHRWLLTSDALQQATAYPVADHRAAELAGRYPGATVHDVTCSVGADLASLTHADGLGGVIGSDIDQIRLAMAAHNVPQAALARADALTPTSAADVYVADPARRSGGRRSFRIEDTAPPLLELLTVYAGRSLVVKCAPGLDYRLLRDRYGFAGEVQIISLNGAVREACLWNDPRPGVKRRATVIRTDGSGFEITDAADDDAGVDDAGEWILDPDGAVVRAGLVRHFAKAHRLWQLDPQIAYLSGDHLPTGERGWRVMEHFNFSEKHLKRRLGELGCGTLEILVRGVDIDPDRLRKRLKLKGSAAHAVVITRIGRRGVMFICEEGVRQR
ncbi:MAG: SAM-dependent methyltransferase [Gordonia sp. (in: high G+C Gram-positive bacteria)]|nr:MAG: SAM-dependent methyltransferase [Gordonia sp. (in: high G+C Gram-positive bacteria)]